MHTSITAYNMKAIYSLFSIEQFSSHASGLSHKEYLKNVYHPFLLGWVLVFLIAYLILRSLIRPGGFVPNKILRINLSHDDAEEWANRIISTLHAVISCITFFAWLIPDSSRWYELFKTSEDYAFSRSYARDVSLGITISYLSFDILRAFYYMFAHFRYSKSIGPSMVMHHLVCAIGFYFGVYYQFGVVYLAFMIQNEISTPSLNNRYFMSALGMKSSIWYLLNDLSFAILFFLDRIVINTLVFAHIDMNYLSWDYAAHGIPSIIYWLMPVLGHSHLLLQYWWFALIVRMMYRKLFGIKYSQVQVTEESGKSKQTTIVRPRKSKKE